MNIPYGYELIVDLHNCNPTLFTQESIKRFCVGLCDLIEMKREDFHVWASDPADYEKDPPHLHGVSVVQFITTSSLVVHTLPKLRYVFVNVFSCKTFDSVVAIDFISDFFDGDIAHSTFMRRM